MGYMRVLAILELSSRRSTFTAVQFIHVKIQSCFGCFKILADANIEGTKAGCGTADDVFKWAYPQCIFTTICLPIVDLRNECTVHV